MALNVTISARAEHNLDQIVQYLSENWSPEVKMEFLSQLASKLEMISKMPYMYRASSKKDGLRECLLNKHTVLYYRIDSTEIQVITIQNSRQNPDNIELL